MPLARIPFARIANVLAIMLSLLSTGCAGGVGGAWDIGRAGHDADLPSGKESYIVLGIQPEYTQVSLFRGRVSDGVFHQNVLLPASFVGQPEDRFIVSRSSARDVLAITYVVMFTNKSDAFQPVLVPCEGAKTAVISVPAGKVIYVGDVRYQYSARGVVPEFSNDLDAAKAYMTTHYPKLAEKLEQGQFDLMPAVGQGQCARH